MSRRDKAGLRVAMYDPIALYQACQGSGPGTSVGRSPSPPGLNIRTKCNTMAVKQQDVPSEQRYALATTQVGSNVGAYRRRMSCPATRPTRARTARCGQQWCTSMADTTNTSQTPCGKPYPGNGNADTLAWMADRSLDDRQGQDLSARAAAILELAALRRRLR